MIATNDETLQKDTLISIQENFETIIINSPPNINYTSVNSLIEVATTSSLKSVNRVINFAGETKNISSAYVFETSDSTVEAIVPESAVNITTKGCDTPVGFARMKYASHLPPDTKSSTSKYSGTDTLVITTCDDAANVEFQDPVVIVYKNIEPPAETIKEAKGKELEPICAYFDPKLDDWKYDGVKTERFGDRVECYITHLTYFSLLSTVKNEY